VSRRRDNHAAPGRRGFTIAEVLVAILITSIVAGVIYGSYLGGLRIIYDSQQDMERTHMASLILDRIASDLACAFLRADKEYLFFVGTGGGEGEYPSDSVTFISSHHERQERDARESTLSIVSYFLAPGDKDELFILRREDPRLDDDPFSGGETRVIGEGVAGLKFEYNGEEGRTSSWDSRESASLPTAVRVKLVFRTDEDAGGKEGEEAVRYTTFVTETAIPAGGNWEEKEEEDTGGEQQKK
jgi:prepilin-type N-terminal cleavage/methylation domain-containing protein